MSSIVNKVKDALSKNDDKTATDTTHTSAAANPAQPRTDTHAIGTHAGSHDTYSAGDNYALGGDSRAQHSGGSTTDGPHSSDLANKLDPRVDSDRDHSTNLGANPQGTASTGTTSHTTHGTSGLHGTTGSSGTHESHRTTGSSTTGGVIGDDSRGLHGGGHNTDGPHGDLGNKLDPRVDSDRDHSKNMGANPHGTATIGDASHTTTHGSSGLHGTTGSSGLHGTTGSSGLHGTTGSSGLHGTAGSTGLHGSTGSSGLHDTTGSTGLHGTTGSSGIHEPHRTTGPATIIGHGNTVADKMDPRVDSSATRDYPSHTSHTGSGAGTGLATGTATGAAAGHHVGHDTDANRGLGGPASKTDGPHASNLANKMDPRVDSDRDGSKNLGANPQGTATTSNTDTTSHGTSAHTGGGAFFSGSGSGNTHSGTGTTGTHSHTTHGAAEGTYGTHDSRLANAADPRIDSDRDGSHTTGAHTGSHTTGTHTTGTHTAGTGITGSHSTGTHSAGTHSTGTHSTGTHSTGTHLTGTHSADTHTAGTHTGTHTGGSHNVEGVTGTQNTGPAPNTAGPHKSDILNKMDPRVDSNLDGSKTMGG